MLRVFLAVALMLPLAGCLADGEEGAGRFDDATESGFEPTTTEYPFAIVAGASPLGANDPARQSWTFEVPEDATQVDIIGEWGCATMCPLHVTIVDADGKTLRDQTSGGWSDGYDAVVGTWTLSVATGDQGATSKTEGKHVVKIS